MSEPSGKGNILKMIQGKLDEQEELIVEQQQQINDLTEKLSALESGAGSGGGGSEDADAVIAEQMSQIIELTERNEALEAQVAGFQDKMKEFEELQAQLKSLLGEG